MQGYGGDVEIGAERAEDVEQAGTDLGAPVRGDDQHPATGDNPREMAQEYQRAGVGPVQVVEHEDDRCLLGQSADEPRQPVDQPHPLLVGLQSRVLLAPGCASEAGGQHR